MTRFRVRIAICFALHEPVRIPESPRMLVFESPMYSVHNEYEFRLDPSLYYWVRISRADPYRCNTQPYTQKKGRLRYREREIESRPPTYTTRTRIHLPVYTCTLIHTYTFIYELTHTCTPTHKTHAHTHVYTITHSHLNTYVNKYTQLNTPPPHTHTSNTSMHINKRTHPHIIYTERGCEGDTHDKGRDQPRVMVEAAEEVNGSKRLPGMSWRSGGARVCRRSWWPAGEKKEGGLGWGRL